MFSVWLNNYKYICLRIIAKIDSLIRESIEKYPVREYHVKSNADVSHKEVKIYCDTNQLPELSFFGPHPNPHCARGLSKHYNLRFDKRLGHGTRAINRIPCTCVACIPMIDQPWINGIPSKKKTL